MHGDERGVSQSTGLVLWLLPRSGLPLKSTEKKVAVAMKFRVSAPGREIRLYS
jgi:hypothetical protein